MKSEKIFSFFLLLAALVFCISCGGKGGKQSLHGLARLNDEDEDHGACQAQNGVEFGKGGVDVGVGLHVVPLGDAHDAVCANLSLTNTGKQANETNSETNAKAQCALRCEVLAHPHQESYESIQTLRSGKRRKDHVGR